MGTIIRLMMLAAHRSVAWSVFVVCETGRGGFTTRRQPFFLHLTQHLPHLSGYQVDNVRSIDCITLHTPCIHLTHTLHLQTFPEWMYIRIPILYICVSVLSHGAVHLMAGAHVDGVNRWGG